MQLASITSGDGLTTLTIHNVADTTIGYTLKAPVEGLEAASIRTVVQVRPGSHGAYIPSALRGERRIALHGNISGSTPAVHFSRRRTFEQVLRIQRDAYGIPKLPTLKFTTDDGLLLQVPFELASPIKMAEVLPAISDYSLDLVADYLLVSQSTTSTNFAIDAGLGAVLPWVLPITLGTSSNSNKTLTNAGNGDAYPTITFTGQVTNPSMYNKTIDRTMALSYTVPAGSTVVIDMLNRTVVENGVTNRIDKLTTASSWWALEPGGNDMFFATANSADTGTANVTVRDSYDGI